MAKLILKRPRKDKQLFKGAFYTAAHYTHGTVPSCFIIRFGDAELSAEFSISEADEIARNFALYVQRAKELAIKEANAS